MYPLSWTKYGPNQFLGEKIHKVNLLSHGYLGKFSAFPSDDSEEEERQRNIFSLAWLYHHDDDPHPVVST